MSGYNAAMAMAACTAFLAMWVHVRFPRLLPERGVVVGLHLVLAIALLHATPAALATAGENPASKLLALAVFVYPVLTYLFLTLAWFIQTVQAHLPGLRR